MRVLYHHRTFGDGAEGIHVREIVEALRQLGHDVSIVAPRGEAGRPSSPGGTRKPSLLARLRTRLPSIAFRLSELLYNLISYQRVWSAIRRERPAFVYERYACFSFGGLLAATHAGVPTILEVNTPYAIAQHGFERLYFERLARAIELRVFRGAAAIVTVSSALRDVLHQTGVPVEKITVMPNAINAARFASGDGEAVRARHGLNGRVVVGFVGSMRAWHGLDLLVAVIPEVVRTNPGCHFLIVGAGELHDQVRRQIESGPERASVTFTGVVPHERIPDYIAAMDIPLMPNSNFYGSPMKVFEYMALGKPTIAPRLGPLEDVIEDGENGILVEPGSAAALRDAILRLASDPRGRERIGTLARERVFARHTWSRNAERVVAIYESLGARGLSHAPGLILPGGPAGN
jgi:glycosyltransferase involved in cell wall biosynthesis